LLIALAESRLSAIGDRAGIEKKSSPGRFEKISGEEKESSSGKGLEY
jgi:hypothetical protein